MWDKTSRGSRAMPDRPIASGEYKNRSARRSIRLLKDAFVQLLAEKPYEEISVTDVTRTADLNRGTFYAHFDNIEDLLRCVLEDFAARVALLLDNAASEDFLKNPRPVLDNIGDYLAGNRELFHKLVTSTSVQPFVDSLSSIIRGKVRERAGEPVGAIADADGLSEKDRFTIVADEYIVDGVFGTYRAWLAGEYGNLPISAVNEGLARLISADATCL